MPADWTFLILRTSVLLALSGCGVLLLCRWQPLASPRWHRLAWGFVLAQGLLLFPGVYRVTLPGWTARLPWARWHSAGQLRHNAAPESAGTEFLGTGFLGTGFLGTGFLGTEFLGTEALRAEALRAMALRPGSAGTGSLGSFTPRLAAADAPGITPITSPRPGGEAAGIAAATRAEAAGPAGARPPDRKEPSPRGGAVRGARPSEPAASPGESSPAAFPASAGRESAGLEEKSAAGWEPGKLVFTAWLAGVAAVLSVLAGNYLLLLWSLRRCRRARPVWSREMERLCLELGLAEKVRLLVHPTLGPFLCSTPLGPRVVVPVRLWNRLTSAERVAVLHHELCHLRRGDTWKALWARLVVALHWFNPLAWLSARRFDESAEWACDWMLAREAPRRATRLASALLTAARGPDLSPRGAVAATGGPVFQRIRRLLTPASRGDALMHKLQWTAMLLAVAMLASLRWQDAAPLRGQSPDTEPPAGTAGRAKTEADETPEEAEQPDEADEPPAEAEQPGEAREAPAEGEQPAAEVDEPPAEGEQPAADDRLAELADRLVVGDNENLRKFAAMLRTPTGRIVMADRAALHAQNAASNADTATLWEQFVAGYFEAGEDGVRVKAERAAELADYARAVEAASADLEQVAAVFQEVAEALDTGSEPAALLKRFLLHEAAPAWIYQNELKSRLHPDVDDLADELGEVLVRRQAGEYVIRPARRVQVERRLAYVEQLVPVLARFQHELTAWSKDLADTDEAQRKFAAALANPRLAEYLALGMVDEESRPTDESLEDVFWRLEEATDEAASGLKLNAESDQYQELARAIDAFQAVWEHRATLREPLERLAARLGEEDELHRRLKSHLQTDLAFLALARAMDYLPVSAGEAAREALAYWVTRNDDGQYELTVESSEELTGQLQDFFAQFREIRRRGRTVDDFAASLQDAPLRAALQSYLGKLALREFLERASVQPEIDGLALWVDEYFEEAAEGLVLRDWAGEVIAEVLEESQEIEAQLGKADF